MKNNWVNPKIENLTFKSTHEELQCGTNTKDGNHWLFKCHHGLYSDGDPAMVTCKYKEHTWVGVIRCTYKDDAVVNPSES